MTLYTSISRISPSTTFGDAFRNRRLITASRVVGIITITAEYMRATNDRMARMRNQNLKI